MAYNFSANQFNGAFSPHRLSNWEVPKWYPPRSKTKHSPVKPIADIHGRLLPNVPRSETNPWGEFKNTWQLPDKISRQQANEINKSKLIESQRWATRVQRFPFKKKTGEAQTENKRDCEDKATEPIDFEYIPGDFTQPIQQHETRAVLDKQKYERDRGKEPELELNDLYLEKHKCTDNVALLNEEERKRREKVPHVLGDDVEENFEKMKSFKVIPDKPTERDPSPVIPAFYNFQTARRMHQENLEHQPLPDCVVDRAFRKLQVEGHPAPGLALDVPLGASGVGVKTYKAGPTHCTKMKVYRPKTSGVVPKPIKSADIHRPQSSVLNKPMGSMDLAICWDYRPANVADEPKRTKHIDGSNGSAAPAVFTLVKTPRTPEKIDTGRSAGVFTSTLGEPGFFDKDIMRRKTGFMQRSKSDLKCSCGTSPVNFTNAPEINHDRSKSASRNDATVQTEKRKRCKSSPNLSQMAVSEGYYKENDVKHEEKQRKRREHTCSKYGPKNKKPEGNSSKKAMRMCQKVAPQPYPEPREKEEYKAAFKAGLPKSNSTGTVTSFDSGCSTMTSSSCSTKVLLIPKPRNPYVKKNYNIDTLVPPFTCYKGGAGQGGYPEHWRLASVYQHAYKPMEQRKRPLLDTVYK